MNKKVGVNLEENRLEHSGSEVLEGDGAQERKTAESGRELTGEEQNLKRLEEENERLRQEIERVRNLPLKERLYDKVHVSVSDDNPRNYCYCSWDEISPKEIN